MSLRVTVAIPVYKRLDYLPGALRAVALQDYPQIELIVSDNGENGNAIPEIIRQHYQRPSLFRQNPQTVSIVEHFNQLVDAATGDLFVLLSDDDEISPTFVSELVGLLERHPQATMALARVETFSEDGLRVLASTNDKPLPPEVMRGEELMRAWCEYRHRFLCFTTNMSRTADLRAVGKYPDFDRGNGVDNALLLKQCLDREVVFSPNCTFRHRIHNTSFGKAASYQSLALASRQFLAFLDDDPFLQAYARAHSKDWRDIKRLVAQMICATYFSRWRTLYRDQLPTFEWIWGGFALPFLP